MKSHLERYWNYLALRNFIVVFALSHIGVLICSIEVSFFYGFAPNDFVTNVTVLIIGSWIYWVN